MKKRIKKENVNLRFNSVIIIVYLVGAILISRLFDLQIVNGAEYRERSNTRLSRESTIEATRGDVLDRSGNVLATTNISFKIQIYKTKSEDEELNKTILNLVNLLEQYETSYPNNFPIDISSMSYKIEGEELSKWLNKYKLEDNTTPEEAVQYFKNKYEISSNNIEDVRKIMAIRYEITTKGYSSTKPLEIAENVPREIIAQVSERNSEFSGVSIVPVSTRTYPNGSLASHIIGYIGKIKEEEYEANKEEYEKDDYVGRTGIEYTFEKYLKGKDGTEEVEMSVDGTITGEHVVEESEQGSSVVLTIDAKLQEIAENALKNNIEKIKSGGFGKRYETKGGAVVVLDVHSGEVLAMASAPDYDPNVWVGGISQADYDEIRANNSLFSKAISGTYEPGSIYKMVTAIAGLESNAIKRNETIYDSGVYTKYKDYQPKCWIYTDYHKGHGALNVSGAIQHSCNYFFYEVGDRMGIDTLDKYARYFGLGKKTKIELPSESAGKLASPEVAKAAGETWSSGRTLQAAIGQSYNNFTPLQIAKYIGIVANGGNKITPTLIKTILNANGTESAKSEINAYVNERLGLTEDSDEDVTISQENLNAVLEGMKSVTTDTGGTAYSIFKNFNIEVVGKTGSAEAGNKDVNAWFAGFAPFNDPEICVVVMVENGGHGYYTAEVAKEIMAEYFGMNMDASEVQEDNQAVEYTEKIN